MLRNTSSLVNENAMEEKILITIIAFISVTLTLIVMKQIITSVWPSLQNCIQKKRYIFKAKEPPFLLPMDFTQLPKFPINGELRNRMSKKTDSQSFAVNSHTYVTIFTGADNVSQKPTAITTNDSEFV